MLHLATDKFSYPQFLLVWFYSLIFLWVLAHGSAHVLWFLLSAQMHRNFICGVSLRPEFMMISSREIDLWFCLGPRNTQSLRALELSAEGFSISNSTDLGKNMWGGASWKLPKNHISSCVVQSQGRGGKNASLALQEAGIFLVHPRRLWRVQLYGSTFHLALIPRLFSHVLFVKVILFFALLIYSFLLFL